MRLATIDNGTRDGRLIVVSPQGDAFAYAPAATLQELVEGWLGYDLLQHEFIDYWSNKWADLLQVNRKFLAPEGAAKFHTWIRQQVADNVPYDQFVRSLLVSSGNMYDQPATNYYPLMKKELDLAEKTSQLFLGVSIGCARCHNHPLEKWTNDQYYAFANLFARVRAKNGPGGDGDKIIFAAASGDVIVIHGFTPHGGMPNRSRRIRYSVDARIQSAASDLQCAAAGCIAIDTAIAPQR